MTAKTNTNLNRFYSNKNADDVCLAIRADGGTAWVERDANGRDFVVTNFSDRAVERVVRRQLWLRDER